MRDHKKRVRTVRDYINRSANLKSRRNSSNRPPILWADFMGCRSRLWTFRHARQVRAAHRVHPEWKDQADPFDLSSMTSQARRPKDAVAVLGLTASLWPGKAGISFSGRRHSPIGSACGHVSVQATPTIPTTDCASSGRWRRMHETGHAGDQALHGIRRHERLRQPSRSDSRLFARNASEILDAPSIRVAVPQVAGLR
jgi:hypothetical protein